MASNWFESNNPVELMLYVVSLKLPESLIRYTALEIHRWRTSVSTLSDRMKNNLYRHAQAVEEGLTYTLNVRPHSYHGDLEMLQYAMSTVSWPGFLMPDEKDHRNQTLNEILKKACEIIRHEIPYVYLYKYTQLPPWWRDIVNNLGGETSHVENHEHSESIKHQIELVAEELILKHAWHSDAARVLSPLIGKGHET